MNKKIKVILGSIGLALFFIVSQAVGGMLLGFVYGFIAAFQGGEASSDAIQKIISSQFGMVLMYISAFIAILILLRIKNKKLTEHIEFKKVKKNDIFLFFCFGFAFQVISVAGNLMINLFWSLEASQKQMINSISGKSVFLTILLVGIMAPIVEELFFRGLIFKHLRKSFDVKVALGIQALLFSLIHFNLYQALPTFLVGILLGVCYIRYHNIVVPILIHAFFNSYAIIQMYVPENISVVTFFVAVAVFIYSIYHIRRKWTFEFLLETI